MIASNPYCGERLAGSVGFPLPGVAVRIADGEGREVARGETGMIEVRGPNVFKGYWRKPRRRTDFRGDGFFITGDVGTMDADGRVAIVGRARDVIISGGLNVYPKEVEQALDQLPGIGEVRRHRRAPSRSRRSGRRRCDGSRRPAPESEIIGVLGREPRPLQDPEADLPRRRTAAQRHGQGAKIRAERALRRNLRRLTPFPAKQAHLWLAVTQNRGPGDDEDGRGHAPRSKRLL